MDSSNIECVLDALSMAYCCNKECQLPGLFMVPHKHYFHLNYNLNRRCIAHSNRCSDSHIHQPEFGLKPKGLTSDRFNENGDGCNGYSWSFPKKACRNHQFLKKLSGNYSSHSNGRYVYSFPHRKFVLKLVCKAIDVHIKHLM